MGFTKGSVKFGLGNLGNNVCKACHEKFRKPKE